jgi:hypothetical protein
LCSGLAAKTVLIAHGGDIGANLDDPAHCVRPALR